MFERHSKRHQKLCRIKLKSVVPEYNHTPSTEGVWFQTSHPSGNISPNVDIWPFKLLSPSEFLMAFHEAATILPGTAHGIFPTFTWCHVCKTLEVHFHMKNPEH